MKLNKYKLGKLIKISEEKNINEEYKLEDVKGISIKKEFIETKADMNGVSLKPYLVVKPDFFAYVTITSRNGEKITLAHNTTNNTYIVSSSYIVFEVIRKDLLNSDYLFMFFNRPEFDRYARFNSWGSAREAFSWNDMCDIELELPDIYTQQKYVNIYNAMIENQKSYERGIEDLKLVCDGYIENLRKTTKNQFIKKYITRYSEKNINNIITKVVGLSTTKEFREPQSRVKKNELSGYKILHKEDIAFVPTTDTWKVLAFAINHFKEEVVVSPIYEVFSIDKKVINPDYLAMWLKRKEFDRYARYHSWGSARENFTFEDMCNVKIPIPSIETQLNIVNIYNVYMLRKKINEQLKLKIKDICSILIIGSLNEDKNR